MLLLAAGVPFAVAQGSRAQQAEAGGQEAPAEHVPKETDVQFEVWRVLVDDFPIVVRDDEPVAPPLGRRNLQFRYDVAGALPSDSVLFRFRMDGLETAWVEAGDRTVAFYRDIVPGTYTFLAEAREGHGRWARTDAVPVSIEPYFYETGWFALLVGLAGALLVGGLFVYQRRQARRQARELERLVEERTRALQEENERAESALAQARAARIEAEAASADADAARGEAEEARAHAEEVLATTEEQAIQLLRMDHLKSRLFANLSHEFRTPLTLILDPLERAVRDELGELDGYARHVLDIARLNALRLLRLINQLLDLSKLEGGGMTLRPREGDLVAFLQRAVDLFGSEAERLGVRLLFRTDTPRLRLDFDPEKLEKIVFNLLANALKADADGGKVLVSVRLVEPETAADGAVPPPDLSADDDHEAFRARQTAQLRAAGYAEIKVRDTGVGIEPEKLPFIFDRFYQTDSGHMGTGIGLSLVKELVELHRGDVLVESQPGFGSTFTVRLPLCHPLAAEPAPDAPGEPEEPEPFSSRDLVPYAALLATKSLPAAPSEPPDAEPPPASRPALRPGSARTANAAANATADPARPLVLVVDDHAELRVLIRTHLEPHYRIAEAANGEQALRCVRELRPDLVVTDVLMPGVDGLELCGRIRADEDLASTPVILLTARGGEETRLRGYDTGADDYLTKPFLGTELLVRVANLLRRRQTMRKQYSEELIVEALARPVQSADRAFIEGVFAAVEAHLADADFTVGDLAEAVGMSQSQLKRRLRAIADQSPVELIRNYRLERAAKLLDGRAGSVSEIAYDVGFNSVSYFSKVFRQHTGKLPSEVLAEAETADLASEPDPTD